MEPLLTYYSSNVELQDEEIEMGCRIATKSKNPLLLFYADVNGPFEPSMKHIFFKPEETVADIKEKLKNSYGCY